MARALSGRRFTFAVLLLFALLAVLATLPVWREPLTRYVGNGGDPEQTFWFLAWAPYAVGHLHDPLISNYINYPDGINLMWNTWVPAAGLLLWPVTALWGPIATYNVVMTASIALSAFFAFLAIRRFVPGPLAATAGALLYGFSPYLIAQELGHMHMVLSSITPPLALLLLDELLVRQRMRRWLLALLIAALGVFQFFVAEEVFVSELIAAAVVAVVLALMHRDKVRARVPYIRVVLAPAVLLTAAVLAVPVAVQFAGPDHISTHGAIHSPDIFLTDPFNLIFPTGIEWLSPRPLQQLTKHFTGNISESDGYLGIPLLATLVYALVRHWLITLVRVAGITAITITVFSLGPHLHGLGRPTPIPLPWWIPAHLPVIDNLQPNRLMIYVFLAAAIGLAFVVHDMWARGRGLLRTAAVAVVSLAPLVPALPLTSAPELVPAYFTTSAVDSIAPGSVVFTAPWTGPANTSGMVFQQASGMRFRLLGGYYLGNNSFNAKHVHDALIGIALHGTAPSLDSASRSAMLAELRVNDVSAVLAGPSPHHAVFVAFVTDLLGAPPRNQGDVDVWFVSGAPTPSR